MAKGQYSTSEAWEKQRNLLYGYAEIQKIDQSKLNGKSEAAFLGKPQFESKIKPINYLDITKDLFKQMYETQLVIHGDKARARAEANALTDSLLDNVDVIIASKALPFKARPEKMITDIHIDVPLSLAGRILGRDADKRKMGLDALIFQDAADIIKILFYEIIDRSSINPDNMLKPDAEITVKITFKTLDYFKSLTEYTERFEDLLNYKPIRRFGVVPTSYSERLPEESRKKLFEEYRPKN